MSLEPKKPIEELLEATARARRAQFGADPTMPNPMRAQLHHEIERLSRTPEQVRTFLSNSLAAARAWHRFCPNSR